MKIEVTSLSEPKKNQIKTQKKYEQYDIEQQRIQRLQAQVREQINGCAIHPKNFFQTQCRHIVTEMLSCRDLQLNQDPKYVARTYE